MSKDKQKVKEKNKGITLIALIITIIVMLILVAVTVTVALNGGLFKTAKEATSQTEVEKEKELLLEVVMGAMGKDGKVDFEKLEESDMFTSTTPDGNNLKVTIAGSERTYTITQRGSITLQDNAGGGEGINPPPTGGGDEPEEPGTGETQKTAGFYKEDGTYTSWDDLVNGGFIGVTDGVIEWFGYYDTTTWKPIIGELVISNDVTSIGNDVFSGFEGLTGINVEANNPNYSSENGVLYDKNKTTIVCYPQGKTESSFTILNSVTSIGNEAFENCSSLTSVIIGNSITSIGEEAFQFCTGLTSVTIPDSVTSIGERAFCECIALTSVTIGNGVTSIGNSAFYNTALTEVNIPDSVTNLDFRAFSGCSQLSRINVTENNNNYFSDDGVLYNKNKTTLVFYPEGKTESIFTIPDSVSTIGSSAFSDTPGLTELIIPSSVTTIKDYAFYNCTGLTTVTIPNSVAYIGYNAFFGINTVYYSGTATGSPWGAATIEPNPNS